jgi:hypothetical protein
VRERKAASAGRMAMRRRNKRPETESSNDNKYNFSTMKPKASKGKRMKIFSTTKAHSHEELNTTSTQNLHERTDKASQVEN